MYRYTICQATELAIINIVRFILTEIQDVILHNQYLTVELLKAIAMTPFNRIPEYSMANNPKKKQHIPLLRQSIFSKIKGQGCTHRVNGPPGVY